MYQYEHHFGSFYHDPAILETVSIASQWVDTELIEKLFLLKNNDMTYVKHQCVSGKVKYENEM